MVKKKGKKTSSERNSKCIRYSVQVNACFCNEEHTAEYDVSVIASCHQELNNSFKDILFSVSRTQICSGTLGVGYPTIQSWQLTGCLRKNLYSVVSSALFPEKERRKDGHQNVSLPYLSSITINCVFSAMLNSLTIKKIERPLQTNFLNNNHVSSNQFGFIVTLPDREYSEVVSYSPVQFAQDSTSWFYSWKVQWGDWTPKL